MMIPLTVSFLVATFTLLFINMVSAQSSSLSAQCVAENKVLDASEELDAKYPYRECIIDVDEEDSCTADFEPVSASYKDACLDAGGQFYVRDLIVDCTKVVSGTTFYAEFTFLNSPNCYGASCTSSELDKYHSTTKNPAQENSLARDGYRCDVTDANEMTTPATNNGQTKNSKSANSGADMFSHFNINGIICLVTSFMFALALFSI